MFPIYIKISYYILLSILPIEVENIECQDYYLFLYF